MKPILKLLITIFLLTSTTALGASFANSFQLIKVCHGKKRLIEPNFSIDSKRTFALIESSVVALKGLSSVIKTKPDNVQMAFGEISTIFSWPNSFASELVLASCSIRRNDGELMCKHDPVLMTLGIEHETIVNSDNSYIRKVTYKNGSGNALVTGKIDNPGQVVINSKTGQSTWNRDKSGREELIIKTSDAQSTFTENSDCSGSLDFRSNSGMTLKATWKYFGSQKTSGSMTVTSPIPSKNFDVNW